MNAPDQIHFRQIVFGDRARTIYNRVPELANLIFNHGLIQPVVLVPLGIGYKEPAFDPLKSVEENAPLLTGKDIFPQYLFGLDAGGRRTRALELLLSEGRWDGVLHHASSSCPGKPGFVLKGEEFATPFERMMTELVENRGREDMDWRDELKLMIKAWRIAQREAHANGEELLMTVGGTMLGFDYMDLKAAVKVHDDFIANPDRYKDVNTIRAAYAKLLREQDRALTKIIAAKSVVKKPEVLDPVPGQIVPELPKINIELSEFFRNEDSLAFMRTITKPVFDHIVTDPDYAIAREVLEANMDTQTGVAQASVEDSLIDLQNLITLAYGVVKDNGFLVFFYDLDHHNKLQHIALDVGWKVQPKPIIWHKTDYRSNAAPGHNFCGNYEVAMVCRKQQAVLAHAQMTSIKSCPSAKVQLELGHPFAKPLDLIHWIYSAIAIKGQTVFDPFMGSGALCIAAAAWGLRPYGREINPDHYARAITNLQKYYRKTLSADITFS